MFSTLPRIYLWPFYREKKKKTDWERDKKSTSSVCFLQGIYWLDHADVCFEVRIYLVQRSELFAKRMALAWEGSTTKVSWLVGCSAVWVKEVYHAFKILWWCICMTGLWWWWWHGNKFQHQSFPSAVKDSLLLRIGLGGSKRSAQSCSLHGSWTHEIWWNANLDTLKSRWVDYFGKVSSAIQFSNLPLFCKTCFEWYALR